MEHLLPPVFVAFLEALASRREILEHSPPLEFAVLLFLLVIANTLSVLTLVVNCVMHYLRVGTVIFLRVESWAITVGSTPFYAYFTDTKMLAKCM